MKTTRRFIRLAAFLAAGFLALCASAQQYESTATLWNGGALLTNSATTATNLSVTAADTNGVNATSYDGFLLEVDLTFTNATAGNFNLTYETSADGVRWNTNKGFAGLNGWFGVPCTNDGIRTIWQTNISTPSLGYWRIGWGTNQTGAACTNALIRAYVKPRRNG